MGSIPMEILYLVGGAALRHFLPMLFGGSSTSSNSSSNATPVSVPDNSASSATPVLGDGHLIKAAVLDVLQGLFGLKNKSTEDIVKEHIAGLAAASIKAS